MKPPMNFTAYKVTSSRNAYGDFVATGETALKCHWRDITSLISDNNEQIDSDAMAWFEPDSGVDKNDLIKFQGTHYKVERVIKAHTLRDTETRFIKVELVKYGAIS